MLAEKYTLFTSHARVSKKKKLEESSINWRTECVPQQKKTNDFVKGIHLKFASQKALKESNLLFWVSCDFRKSSNNFFNKNTTKYFNKVAVVNRS